MMKALFELTHPKHFYQFRYVINEFTGRGDEVKIIARDKDVLLQVLKDEGFDYEIYGKHKKKLKGKIFNILRIFFNYLKIVRKVRPDYIISKASFYAVLIRPFTRAKLVITPDSEVVWLTRKIVAPLSPIVITPDTYTVDYGKKQKRLNGFFEECYLSPLAFKPDKKILENAGIDLSEPYFVLRFISWDANHDVGQFGFSDEEKIKLVEELSKHGRVVISAEQGKVHQLLQRYLSTISPNHIHHLLHFAHMYIGDSQTMATESALLGTPSLRYNSFVGPNDMSNFIILESEHGLMRNFSDFRELMNTAKEMLKDPDLKKKWLQKRNTYFDSKPDLNKQLIRAILDES
jgi:predicted glycosyltransferase